jgi:uncharacterized protein (TIGR02118 family)
MNHFVSRRAMLAATGSLGAAGLLRSFPVLAQAPAAAPGGLPPICLSTYYFSGDGAKFDGAQYRDEHIPMVRGLYGDSIERIELRMAPKVKRNDPGPSTSYAEAKPPILAITSVWVRSLETFAAAALKSGTKVADDLKGITRARASVQWEQLIAAQGESRESVTQGAKCNSMVYWAKEGGRFDEKYYTESYMPVVKEVYGEGVIRRMEVCKALSLQGNKPVFASAVNMYIQDQKAFMDAGRKGGMRLMQEGPKFTDLVPLISSMEVWAVG